MLTTVAIFVVLAVLVRYTYDTCDTIDACYALTRNLSVSVRVERQRCIHWCIAGAVCASRFLHSEPGLRGNGTRADPFGLNKSVNAVRAEELEKRNRIVDLTTGVAAWSPALHTRMPPDQHQPSVGAWLGKGGWNPLLSATLQHEQPLDSCEAGETFTFSTTFDIEGEQSHSQQNTYTCVAAANDLFLTDSLLTDGFIWRLIAPCREVITSSVGSEWLCSRCQERQPSGPPSPCFPW